MANQYSTAASKFTEGYQRLLAKDYREAVVAFGAAIDLFPLFETAYRFRAEAHRNLGQEPESRADLESVISISQTRRREAEKMLVGGRARRPETPGPSPAAGNPPVAGPVPASANPPVWSGERTRAPVRDEAQGRSILQSPIVIVTGVASLVMLLAAVILIVFGGG